MKSFIALLFVLSLLVHATSVNAQDVMSTSVTVVAPENILEINKMSIGGLSDQNITVYADLEKPEEDVFIDKVVFSIVNLDGSVEQVKEIYSDKLISGGKEESLKYDFPRINEKGNFVGLLQLYSKDRLVGSSKTVINIKDQQPQVLGTATVNYEYLLPRVLIISSLFTVILASIVYILTVLGKSKIFEFTKYILTLTSFVGASVFGFAVGYLLVQKLLNISWTI